MSKPGTPTQTGEVFGYQFAQEEESSATPNDWSDAALDREASDVAPEVTQEPAPAEPSATPQEQEQGQPDEGSTPDPGQEQAPEGESAEAQAARLYAGRYRTPEELEKGYKNIQRLQTRTQAERQRAELEAQQLRAALQEVRPYLEQLRADPGSVDDGFHDPTQLDADQLRALIDKQVSQRVQQVQQQTQAEQTRQELRRTVESFIATHPDAAPGTELDEAIGDVLAEFQTDAEGNRRFDLFPVTEGNLEVAYTLAKEPDLRNMVVELDLVPNTENIEIAREAVSNPALAEVLLANPTLVDTEHGLNFARKQAALPGMYADAAQRGAAPSPEQARRAAYVETGGTGAPVMSAPGANPPDPFDEAIAAYNRGRESNIFGLAVD